MNLRSGERSVETRQALVCHIQQCPEESADWGWGIVMGKGGDVPEDSPVCLLSLLPIDQTGEKTKGLCA